MQLRLKLHEKKRLVFRGSLCKYRNLNNIQVEAMTGLDCRQQVTAPNFGSHTVSAIRDIQKRTEELSSGKAFEMVRGKTYRDTHEFVESYLSATKKAQKPIGEMDLIRVVVTQEEVLGTNCRYYLNAKIT